MALRESVVVGGVGIGLGVGLLGLVLTQAIDARRQAQVLALARRLRTREKLQFFIDRTQEYDWRMRSALADPVYLEPEFVNLARQDAWGFLGGITRWVHDNIAWTRDLDTSGVAEHWQTPSITLATRRGDCEDMSLLALRIFQAAGINAFRVVVGVWKGEGHAWLETPDGLFVDPVPGIVVRGRPRDYEPAVMLGEAVPLVWPIAA
jgi:predicted transglutaminase-like cysteine proteinase